MKYVICDGEKVKLIIKQFEPNISKLKSISKTQKRQAKILKRKKEWYSKIIKLVSLLAMR